MTPTTAEYAAAEQIRSSFKTDEEGRIISPGKFEGEMIYVPYFWDMLLTCGGDGDEDYFDITVDDIELFPELGETERLYLSEDDNGFVYGVVK